ncbi:MAG: hypothetical protein Harvfovirus15_15 [Harvfovirus sp.]|uniref:Uncharacterized protein n=1 Tax=Harvfovirus sp. TaxID=2487768 RepID=A0A3G5A4C5_9VIRU|nr:MAG: hypothetical protein Harvfovirus15_15 [Harvfovirus sp.]
MQVNYHHKYLKYKKKYFQLKTQHGGLILTDVEIGNAFDDLKNIEETLNWLESAVNGTAFDKNAKIIFIHIENGMDKYIVYSGNEADGIVYVSEINDYGQEYEYNVALGETVRSLKSNATLTKNMKLITKKPLKEIMAAEEHFAPDIEYIDTTDTLREYLTKKNINYPEVIFKIEQVVPPLQISLGDYVTNLKIVRNDLTNAIKVSLASRIQSWNLLHRHIPTPIARLILDYAF